MIVDTSALLAILLGEPEADDLTLAIARSDGARLSAASYVEAGIRVDQSKNPIAQLALDDLIERLGIEIEPVSVDQAYAARVAHRAYELDSRSLALQRPTAPGTYWENYVAWALAYGVIDRLLEEDGRSSDSSVYRLTALGEKKAHEFG